MNLYEAMKQRRSRYAITNTSPISDERIEEILKEAITYTPSAFNSRSSRVVLLYNDQHQKLWDIVKETLRKRVPADKFAPTEEKINSFAAGYGTILYFEDEGVVKSLQENFAAYAENFPIWSQQSAGMLQYVVWTALAQDGLGASLQHYNPIIDDEVKKEFNINPNWKLIAQMPFGTPTAQPDALPPVVIEERLRVLGKNHD